MQTKGYSASVDLRESNLTRELDSTHYTGNTVNQGHSHT